MSMFIRSPYNYDGDIVSFQTGLDCSEAPTRAQQHFRDECDINTLVKQFARTGVPPAPSAPPMAIFEEAFDFQTAMQAVVDARVAFDALPSDLRYRFHNDPGAFLAFVHDDANRDEALKLGLIAPTPDPVAPEPLQVVVVNPDTGEIS